VFGQGEDGGAEQDDEGGVEGVQGAEDGRSGGAEEFARLQGQGEAALGVDEEVPGGKGAEDDEYGPGFEGFQEGAAVRFLGRARAVAGFDLFARGAGFGYAPGDEGGGESSELCIINGEKG
jgi:hypothetical protein